MARKGLQELFGRDPKYQHSFDVQGRPAEALAPDLASAPQAKPAEPVRRASADKAGGAAPASDPAAAPTPVEEPAAPAVEVPSEEPALSAERRRLAVAVNVRPLATQAARIAATSLPCRDILKAAWRKAIADLTVDARYVAPAKAKLAGGADTRFVTSLSVDEDALTVLAREHDPLGVKSHWSLIRGQVEPAVWKALDEVLARVAERK